MRQLLALIAPAALLALAGSALANPSREPPAPASDQPLTREEARAIVAEMLADAESRSSLLQGSSATAGYDRNFFLASADGNFRLNFSGYTQLRYLAVFRNSGRAPTGLAGQDNDFEGGFENRRTRLKFSGNVVSPDLTYVVQSEFSDTSGSDNSFLRDAFFVYQLGDGWFIKGGQYKLPFLREEYMDDTRRLAVEGSQTTNALNPGRSQAIELGFRKSDYRVLMDFSDGLNTLNTDFATAAGAPNPAESDFAFTGRADWALAGAIADFDEFTSKVDAPWVFNLGAAVHVQGSSNVAGAGGTSDATLLAYTADALLKGHGLSLFFQFYGASTHRQGSPPTLAFGSTDDYGIVAQAGWRFLENDEAFFRYDAVFYDRGRGFNDDRQDFVTAGLNHYFAGHAAKLTANAVVALQPTTNAAGTALVPSILTGASTLTPGQGILRSTSDGTVALQVQMQLMF